MKPSFIKTSDEITMSKTKKCPLYRELKRLKRKLKNICLKNLIVETTCHIHKNEVHMFHHKIFCRIFCKKNYNFMLKKYKTQSTKAFKNTNVLINTL